MKSKDVASTKTRKMDIFESVWLHGVHPNAESSSAVCIPPRSQALWCASHHGVKRAYLSKSWIVGYTFETLMRVDVSRRLPVDVDPPPSRILSKRWHAGLPSPRRPSRPYLPNFTALLGCVTAPFLDFIQVHFRSSSWLKSVSSCC